MNKLFSKFVSVVTAMVMTLFVSSSSLQTFVNEIDAHAAETDVVLGDVNGDERVDVFDLCLMKRELMNPGTTSIDKTAADVNADGVLDVKDVTEVQEFLLCKRDHFSASQTSAISDVINNVNAFDYSIATQDEPTETSLTVEIAKSIDEAANPVAVYELLYNNVDTEFYFGSRKGAIGTYDQHGGNDIDQASLLIASFRRLGYEADYISGLVKLTPEQAMSITGTTDNQVALDIMKTQAPTDIKSIEVEYDTQNHMTSITIEHTWVKAMIPSKYIKSDGNDELVEVQIDTSFKGKQRLPVSGTLTQVIGTDSRQIIEDVINSGSTIDIYKAVDAAELFSSQSDDELLNGISQYKNFSTIPIFDYEIVSNTIEGNEYLTGRRDQIQINIEGGKSVVLNSVDLYGKRLVVEYDFDSDYELYKEFLLSVPETIFDIKQSDTKAGIKVQPYIKLDGQVIGTGGSVEIGSEQKMTITIYTCGAVQELKSTNMLSGSMYAINIDTQNVSSGDICSSIQEMSLDMGNVDFRTAYKDDVLGKYLSLIGRVYMAQSDLSKTMYAEQYGIHAERYLSVCVTAFNLGIIPNIIGQLEVQDSGTIGLDVKSDSFSAVSLNNIQDDIDKFYLNVGIQGSYLEGEVLEAITGIESISTMKALDVARQQGVDIVSISKDNVNYQSLLDTLKANGIPSYSLSEITEKVEAGYEVITPIKNIHLNSWTGIGYIIANNNGYSFMLSNGTNGGETTDAVTNLKNLVESIVFWAFVAALVFSVISFCSAAWAFVPILAGEKALTFGAVASVAWSTYAVSSAADGLGDVIDGTVNTGTKARVTVTTLGKALWKLIWKVVNG